MIASRFARGGSASRQSDRVRVCPVNLREANADSPQGGSLLADTLRGIFFLDIVAKEAPGRARADETAPGVSRDAGVFECPGAELDPKHSIAFVVTGGAQVAPGKPFHFHPATLRLALLRLLRLVRSPLAVAAVGDLAAARANVAFTHGALRMKGPGCYDYSAVALARRRKRRLQEPW